ncbi:MAG TPA: LacI family DNA-binding transcriptional regulator [Cellulomonas sp.]
MKRRTKVTIADVAELAGVSRATVSRVLNSTVPVAPDKARAVHEAVASTGFLASTSARQLATGRAESVAVLLTEPVDELFADPTFVVIFKGILDGLTPTPLTPALFTMATEREREKSLRRFQRGAADALIHLSPYTDDGLLPRLRDLALPVVLCGQTQRQERYEDVFSTVYSDDAVGAALAADYLIERGARRIRAVMGPAENPATTDRLRGYRQVLGDRLDPDVRFGPWDEESGRQATADLCTADPGFDTVICGNDRIARGALQALAAAGRRVPQDVRVVGFDDHPVAATTTPTITSVHQPFHEQGVRAVEVAVEMIEGAPPRTEVLAMHVVARQSA